VRALSNPYFFCVFYRVAGTISKLPGLMDRPPFGVFHGRTAPFLSVQREAGRALNVGAVR
jgi:hypothetical protein